MQGSITGCFSATVLLPSEVIKAKTQVVVGRSVSSQEIVRQMIKSQGMRSMFVGFDAQLCRDAPFYAFFFGGYDLFVYGFKTYVPTMPEELNYFLRYVRFCFESINEVPLSTFVSPIVVALPACLGGRWRCR